jgi:hypothetical protein
LNWPGFASTLCLAALAAVVTPESCLTPAPSDERVTCLQGCARQKDSCIIEATDAEGLHTCDRQSATCGATCGS